MNWLADAVLKDKADAENYWQSLSYDDKCNAFYAVISKLYQAEIIDKRSYRGTLYDAFDFGPDMYTRGMDCGYMAIHNSIMTDDQFNEAHKWIAGNND